VSALSLNKLRQVGSMAGDRREQMPPCTLAIEGVGRGFWRPDRLPLPAMASYAPAIGLAVATRFGRIATGINIDDALASTLPFPTDHARRAHGGPRFPARFPENRGFRHKWSSIAATLDELAALARAIDRRLLRVVTLPSTYS
jgi:hypothetical protein